MLHRQRRLVHDGDLFAELEEPAVDRRRRVHLRLQIEGCAAPSSRRLRDLPRENLQARLHGLDPLVHLLQRPRDRDVVCHASAWYIDDLTDLRIKMCIEPTEEAFRVIHHELGHDFYFRSYKDQPFLYQNGADDGFHEAIGDAIALSVTPSCHARVIG